MKIVIAPIFLSGRKVQAILWFEYCSDFHHYLCVLPLSEWIVQLKYFYQSIGKWNSFIFIKFLISPTNHIAPTKLFNCIIQFKNKIIPSTSFTAAAYGSHQNVFIRMDPLGRPPSANSGSYATIASLNKFPLSESKKSCKSTKL